MYILLTHGIGAAGGLFARRHKIPAGAMIGSLALVALFCLLFNREQAYPANLRIFVQICSGMVIGSRFTRRDVLELRKMLLPALILVAMLFGFNLLFALLITHVSNMDLMTALFACAPGGVSDLALIAVDFGADTELVTLLQLFRFVFVLTVFPPFMKKRYLSGIASEQRLEKQKEEDQQARQITNRQKSIRLFLSLGVSCAGGLLLRSLHIPAGPIVGAIVGILILSLAFEKIYVPGWLKLAVQISCGCYVGMQLTREALFSIPTLWLPMLLVIVEVLCMAFITAIAIRALTGLDMATCLFSSIPGGIAEMSMIAEDLGLDIPKIVVMHTCRVIAVICIMPQIVHLFA